MDWTAAEEVVGQAIAVASGHGAARRQRDHGPYA
jgi:hypothetical protein